MKPWREVARPHKDVLEGTFQQSDFAADISRVANGTATPDAVRACFRRASRRRRPRMRPLQHPQRLHCHDNSDTSGEENWVKSARYDAPYPWHFLMKIWYNVPRITKGALGW